MDIGSGVVSEESLGGVKGGLLVTEALPFPFAPSLIHTLSITAVLSAAILTWIYPMSFDWIIYSIYF